MAEIAQLVRDVAKERDNAHAAIRQAIPCLDTDKDLTDEHVAKHCHPTIAARRAALRHCEAVLDSQNAGSVATAPTQPG